MTRLRPLILVLWLAGWTRAVGQTLPDPVTPNSYPPAGTRMASELPAGQLTGPALAGNPNQPQPSGYYTTRYQPAPLTPPAYPAPVNPPATSAGSPGPYTMPAVSAGAQMSVPQALQQELPTLPPGVAPPSMAPTGPGPLMPSTPYPGMGGACPTTNPCPAPAPEMQLTGIIAPAEKSPMAWIEFDALLWWIKNAPNPPPIVTTGNLNQALPGALGDPATRILYGDHSIGFADFVGGRLTAGTWLTYDHTVGIEASGFLLEHKIAGFNTSSDLNGNPLISRPFFNTLTNAEDVVAVSIPGAQYGNVQVASVAGLGGANLDLFAPLMKEGCWTLTGRVGARYLNLSERLTVTSTTGTTEQLAGIGPLLLNGNAVVDYPSVLTSVDSYRTVNNFWGGQAGLSTAWQFDRLNLRASGEVAVGTTQQILDIFGSSTQFASLGSRQVLATTLGGVFAVPSNSGNFSRTRFGVVPTFELQASYLIFPNLSLNLGYNFLYINSVVRPGNNVDRVVNPVQSPPLDTYGMGAITGNPTVPFNSVNFWAQGINLGLALSY